MSGKSRFFNVQPSGTTALIPKVDVCPSQQRYSHQWLRRFCSAFFSGLCIFYFMVSLYLLIFPPTVDDHSKHSFLESLQSWNILGKSDSGFARIQTNGISYNELQDIVLSTPDAGVILESSRYYSAAPHLAGKNLSQALWTRDLWREYGIDAEIVSYDVYLNYPKSHRLALLDTKKNGTSKVKFEARLEERVLKEDPTTSLPNRVPTFHGYSASGNVTAQYVYANYGTYKDFDDLVQRNISLKGKIALVKYGHIFRGLKVKRAQELGMVGCVIYTDPGDDRNITIENGYKSYPNGPARHPDSVERGSVEFLSYAPGDPTTPGYASKPGVPRQDPANQIPKIPSIPISYEDALPLLKSLNGYGPNATSFNKWWQTGGLRYRGVNYNVGPSPENTTLNLVNEQEYTITPLWNVIGTIKGASEETVLIGNHRDAWIAGGAADPNSGSACMNEVVRSLGKALTRGWRPMRTIVFGSWDGEEYGLVGSTEWVEDNIEHLGETTIAYLNVDTLGTGPVFKVASSPLLDKAIKRATKLVLSPNQTTVGQTLYDVWDKTIQIIGSGSDFTAFQDKAGIPSLQYAFSADSDSPVYHYHSNYDSFHWMTNFGDPGYHYHVALTKLWALTTIMLGEGPIVQFAATDYAKAFKKYLDTIEKSIEEVIDRNDTQGDLSFNIADVKHSLEELKSAAFKFHANAEILDTEADRLSDAFAEGNDIPWYRWWRRARTYRLVRMFNARYKFLERHFLYKEGLDGRPWYEHTIYAPGRWTGYAGNTLPGLVESVEDRNSTNFKRWAHIIGDQIIEAAESMHMPRI